MRHPLPLLTREVSPLYLGRNNTLCLIQDLHNPFANPAEGWLARLARAKSVAREFDEYVDSIALIAPNITKVLRRFRELGMAVVYSCLGFRGETGPSAWQEAIGWVWDLDGPDGAFPLEWCPEPDEPVFTKPGWGALDNKSLCQYFDQHTIRNVVILGGMFDFGIRHSCYQLADRGISSLVVSDGVAALTQAAVAPTAGNLAHGMTKFRSTAELLDLLVVMQKDGIVQI